MLFFSVVFMIILIKKKYAVFEEIQLKTMKPPLDCQILCIQKTELLQILLTIWLRCHVLIVY